MRRIYLAIPYTGMEESSYEQSILATAAIIKNNPNVTIYSPIINSHPLTKHGLEGTWEYWQDVDLEWLALCDTLVIVIPREGVERAKKSIGLESEHYCAVDKGLEILCVNFEDINDLII